MRQSRTQSTGVSAGCQRRLALRPFGTVFGAGVLPILDSHGIQRSTHHMVPDAREILDAATANQDDGMFLQVVPDARDVGGHLDPVGEAHARHLAQRGIGLFRGRRVHPRAYAAPLGAPLQSRTLRLIANLRATGSH